MSFLELLKLRGLLKSNFRSVRGFANDSVHVGRRYWFTFGQPEHLDASPGYGSLINRFATRMYRWSCSASGRASASSSSRRTCLWSLGSPQRYPVAASALAVFASRAASSRARAAAASNEGSSSGGRPKRPGGVWWSPASSRTNARDIIHTPESAFEPT